MSVTDNVFTVPALYDQYLGSLLFQPYASDIAGRLTDLTGGRLLERLLVRGRDYEFIHTRMRGDKFALPY